MNQSIQNSTFILANNLDIPMNQRRMSIETQSFRMVVLVVGSLINFLVTAVIGCSRQLHYPRHLYWVAISLNNQFCIIQAVIQIMANLTQIKVTCQIFVLNAGVSFTIILTFLALTALDRYLAVARYEWYKKKVTNRGTISLLSIAFAVTYLASTSPFWTGYKNIQNCTINMTHIQVLLIYDLLLGIFCIILHAMIFVRSRKIRNEQPPNFLQTPIALQFRPNLSIHSTPGLPVIEEPRQEGNSIENAADATDINALQQHLESQLDDPLCFSWFANRSKLNRQEIRAALSLSINMLPFWLCTFPVTVNGILIYWCVRLQSNCPTVYRVNPYLVDWFIVHTLYNPLMYMFTSIEFKRALIHLKKKIKFNFSSSNRG